MCKREIPARIKKRKKKVINLSIFIVNESFIDNKSEERKMS